MTNKSKLLNLFIAFLGLGGANADAQTTTGQRQPVVPSDLTCVLTSGEHPNGRWRLKNQVTGAWIGDEVSRGDCNRSLDSLVTKDAAVGIIRGSTRPYICAGVEQGPPAEFRTPSGFNVFDPATGDPIVGRATFEAMRKPRWLSMNACRHAVNRTNHDFVCVPKDTGSVAYNAREDFLMGTGSFFRDINDCTITTAWATYREICAPNGLYYSIYDRRYGSEEPSREGRFESYSDCHCRLYRHNGC